MGTRVLESVERYSTDGKGKVLSNLVWLLSRENVVYIAVVNEYHCQSLLYFILIYFILILSEILPINITI